MGITAVHAFWSLHVTRSQNLEEKLQISSDHWCIFCVVFSDNNGHDANAWRKLRGWTPCGPAGRRGRRGRGQVVKEGGQLVPHLKEYAYDPMGLWVYYEQRSLEIVKEYLMMRLIEMVEDQERCHQTWFSVEILVGCPFQDELVCRPTWD